MNKTLKRKKVLLSKIEYDRQIEKPENAHLTNEKGRIKRIFYRKKKRIYIDQIHDIEEFQRNTFNGFTDASLTLVTLDDGQQFVAEIAFDTLDKFMDQHDKANPTIKYN